LHHKYEDIALDKAVGIVKDFMQKYRVQKELLNKIRIYVRKGNTYHQ